MTLDYQFMLYTCNMKTETLGNKYTVYLTVESELRDSPLGLTCGGNIILSNLSEEESNKFEVGKTYTMQLKEVI